MCLPRKPKILHENGIDRVARLGSNENPESITPAAREAAWQALLNANRYPDERVNILMNALREYYGDSSFVTGVGMDGVIETVIRTLVDPGEKVAISTPTFSFYALAAMGQGAEVVTVPRKADFSVDPGTLIKAAQVDEIDRLFKNRSIILVEYENKGPLNTDSMTLNDLYKISQFLCLDKVFLKPHPDFLEPKIQNR